MTRGSGGWRRAVLAIAAIGVLATSTGARADDAGTAEPEPDWEFRGLLYGWVPQLSATLRAGDLSQDLDLSIGDVLDDVTWAASGAGEIRYKRALLLVDLYSAQLLDSGSDGPKTRSFQRRPNFPGGTLTLGGVDASSRSTMFFVDAKAGWRVLSAPFSKIAFLDGTGEDHRIDLDFFVGLRSWYFRQKIRVNVAPATLTVGGQPVDLAALRDRRIDTGRSRIPGRLLAGGSASAEESTTWVDPLIGMRLQGEIVKNVSLFTLGDLGGFGWGEASTFTWQAMGGVDWRFAEHFDLVVAYRALGVQRTSIDPGVLYGPMMGVGVRF